MAFIKTQKVVRDNSGKIISGSASIVDSIYVPNSGKNHSKQQIKEKLGKIIYLEDDKKSGIFLSPARGLIEYDAVTDSFTAVEQNDSRIDSVDLFPKIEIHTVFGDSYLFLSFLKKCGLLSVLRNVFPKDEMYERVLCHILHSILKDGSRISCDNFIRKSFASYLLQDIPWGSLYSDTRFFTSLGEDALNMILRGGTLS